jgi:hypothetical protein
MTNEQLIADAREAGMPPAYGCKTRHDIENDDCPCDENGNCTQSELVWFQINRIENLAVIAAIRDARKDAEIARLRELATWQPIETAPQETPILIGHWFQDDSNYYGSKWLWIISGEYEGKDFYASFQDDIVKLGEFYHTVTHWMPLPEPPKSLAQGEQK